MNKGQINRRNFGLSRNKANLAIALAVTLLVVIGAEFFGASLHDISKSWMGEVVAKEAKDTNIILTVIGFFCLLIGLLSANYLRKRMTHTHVNSRKYSAIDDQRKVLICGLSLLGRTDSEEEKSKILIPIFSKENLATSTTIHAGKMFPWQQNLRVIHKHGDRLKYVYLVCSDKTNDYFEEFRNMLNSILQKSKIAVPQKIEIKKFEKIVNMDDGAEIARSVKQLVRQIEQETGFSPNEMTIDITSGTSAFSAGAMFALANENILVTWADRTGKVHSLHSSFEQMEPEM